MFASVKKTREAGEKPEMYPLRYIEDFLRLYRRTATEDRILQQKSLFHHPVKREYHLRW
jgi:hypothetical protein